MQHYQINVQKLKDKHVALNIKMFILSVGHK